MTKSVSIGSALIFLFLKLSAQKHDDVYHYSIMDAMRNGIYEGEHDSKYLAGKGNFGLGTYNFLDGELVVLDGVFYRVTPEGKVMEEPDRMSPFVSLVQFTNDSVLTFSFKGSAKELQQKLLTLLPSQNMPYAIKINTSFYEITTGGSEKIAAGDTRGIAEVLKKRPLYKAKNIRGTLVGFYNPPYFSGIDLSPFHFHFISEDKTYGGHLIDGILNGSITLFFDEKNGYRIELLKKNTLFRSISFKKSNKNSSY